MIAPDSKSFDASQARACYVPFEALIEHAHDLIVVLDDRAEVRYANAAFGRQLGLAPRAMEGQRLEMFAHPDDEGRLHQAWRRAADDESNLVTFRLKHAEGGWRILEGRCLTVPTLGTPSAPRDADAGGQVRALIAQDVTTRVLAQQTLKEERKQLRRTRQAGRIGDLEVNLTTSVVHGSEQLYRLLGLEPRLEMSFEELLAAIAEEDRDHVKAAIRIARESFDPFSVTCRVARPDGQQRSFLVEGEVEYDGLDLMLYGIVQDVTERYQAELALRQSEAKYRSVVSGLVEGVLLVNEELRITAANGSAAEILGVDQQELQGACFDDLDWRAIHPDGRPFDLREFPVVRTLEEGSSYTNVRVGLRAGDDSVRWISVNTKPIFREESARPHGAVASFQDITERMDNQRALERSREQLRNLALRLQSAQEKERTRLSREVHDVLGQAMTALRMNVQWIDQHLTEADDDLRARLRDTNELIESTIQTVRRIARDLRPGILDHFGLPPALDWQTKEFAKRTDLICAFEDHTDGAVDGMDKDQATAIFRVFQEALTNVARHADARHVDAALRLCDGRLRLEVRDDGRGIRPDEITNSKSLGLLGMRERLMPWHGTVDHAGAEGEGTTVTVTVPLSSSD